jgi:phage N-6-adenine-methyltransferase
MSTMPKQRPGLSKQDYATPKIFIDAVKHRFAIREFAYDLAASKENTKARHFFCKEQDTLKQDWTKLKGDLWLNPEYAHIAPYAEKCAASAPPGVGHIRRIFFLVPAGVGANWFAQHVDKKAFVLFNNGRLSFDGVGPYPKDTILAVFGIKPGYECWPWKGSK